MSETILKTEALCKNYGRLKAVDQVSIAFKSKKVHAVIGPNGAGKTTLLKMLFGEIRPCGGNIHYKGKDITDSPPHKKSHLGIGKTYQQPNIFLKSSCFENIRIAAQSCLMSSFRFIKAAKNYSAVNAVTLNTLQRVTLDHKRNDMAFQLSYGEQRQLEIGMMLATGPELLLMDEPLSGMGWEDSKKILDLIKEISHDHHIILIEHDMDAVFEIADIITVMSLGKVLITGKPSEVRLNPVAQEVYLGEKL
ncbi:MAG: ABC transporter ATP-binding protein [Deltaproteobacteria bacterium]|nr:ABC transporter ATP-binding protein [Deltaproteobacteria bacterium]